MQFPISPTHGDLALERTELILRAKVQQLKGLVERNAEAVDKLPRAERCLMLQRRIELLQKEVSISDVSDFSLQNEAENIQNSLHLTMGERVVAFAATPDPSRQGHVNPTSTSPKRTWPGDISSSTPSVSPDALRSMSSSPPQLVDVRMPKRFKLSVEDKPCLRCKILKKKCDALQSCAHCPQQSFDNESDYWKVLGCLRGQLRELASVFCPDFTRSSSRVLRCRSGSFLTIDFALTKSRVSPGKKNRILNLIQTRKDFVDLADSAWENLSDRQNLCRQATAPFSTDNDLLSTSHISSEEYEAPWALLQAASMDTKYSVETEYNAFALFRLGNSLSKDAQASWDIFCKSRRLLRQSVEIYLLERLCGHIASGDLVGPPPFDPAKLPASNSLILVDIRPEIEEFLDNFERICSGRAKLTGHAQMACFYALLTFNIAKSLLIDAYSIRSTCDDINPWNETCALRITSAYKSLVSIFSWSSKSDVMHVMQQRESDMTKIGIYGAWLATKTMVRLDTWEERGFKSTRDFLLGLGSFVTSNGTYNGFFIQKFGLESVPRYISASASTSITGGNWNMPTSSRLPSAVKSPSKANSGVTSGFHSFKVISPATSLHQQEQGPDSPETLAAESDGQEYPQSRHSHARSASNSTTPQESLSTTFTFVTQDQSGQSSPQHGRRRGALDQETLKKVREMRKIGACWNCWVMKVPCSEGPPDEPSFFNSRFTTEFMEIYNHDNIDHFTLENFQVEISWIGESRILLPATRFVTTPHATALEKYQSQRTGNPLGIESLPIGLLETFMSDAEKTYLNHLGEIINGPSYPQLLSNDHTSRSYQVAATIHSFYRSMPIAAPSARENEQVQDQVELYIAAVNLQLVVPEHLVGEPQKTCQALENLPFAQLSHLFHTIYRTAQVEKGGLNPFRSELASNEFDEPTKAMIRSFRDILDEIPSDDFSMSSEFDQGSGEVAKSNSGRMVSKFLALFIGPKAP
ncbi:hypothetical protein G7Y89_g5925 [Cudoniella acicularis]|uniref:Zn(2)-C6 fungal-type domain-containing protein n=1 Tax=Cudoniella acicularis TaxID=354080 RepID=A0A8H4RPS2_9HELO|nr:hypothetical protein G7Y89_g5925 [Cudoniella acicularis]